LYAKLLPKLRELLIDQKAKSVEYELIRTIIAHFKEGEEDRELRGLAVERLQGFLTSKDANCKEF
jgi:hypothetical protein